MAQNNPTVKLYNGASKTEFSKLSFDDQKSLYYQFQRYAVRKEIADNNALLSSIFKKVGDYSSYFNAFNSAFIGNHNMIDLLYDGELDSLPYMSNASFESKLSNAKFERQIALICYSLRNNERIPNRVDFPVLIAYANMQNRVLKYYRQGVRVIDAIDRAGQETREEFLNKYGCSMGYEYKKLPSGEKYLVDRNVTPRVGYSGTLGVAQGKAYQNLVNAIMTDLFENEIGSKNISQALEVLIQKVCAKHLDDPDFNVTTLIEEVIYRFFMPTNKMKEDFRYKLNELNKTTDYRVKSSIEGASEKLSDNVNSSNFANLEKFKSESYKIEVYKSALKKVVEKALMNNVGLKKTAEFEKTSDEVKPSERGE